jgi:hypothetical protein
MTDITLHYYNQQFASLGPIMITEEFINYRNEHRDKFNDYGRTIEEKTRHADALVVEYLILNNGWGEHPKNIRYDFYINSMNIDNKMINEDANTVTIPNRKLEWMKESVITKDLTHLSITQWTLRPEECKGKDGRALKSGDIVKFNMLNIKPARETLSGYNLHDSIYYENSKYFWVK